MPDASQIKSDLETAIDNRLKDGGVVSVTTEGYSASFDGIGDMIEMRRALAWDAERAANPVFSLAKSRTPSE